MPSVDLKTSSIIAKSSAIRLRIEEYYEGLARQFREREKRIQALRTQIDGTMDGEVIEKIIKDFSDKEELFLRSRRVRLSSDDFAIIQIIGRGAFGTVFLVQKRDTGQLYAMKRLRKIDMLTHSQFGHIRAERDILVLANSEWVVQLYYSFQDTTFLYLVMEYLGGGDLMSLLIKEDIFPEQMARFYIAECVMAIAHVHTLGFIHRDLKPDNILFDTRGHIKLSDFGLSTGFEPKHSLEYYHQLFNSGSKSDIFDQTVKVTELSTVRESSSQSSCKFNSAEEFDLGNLNFDKSTQTNFIQPIIDNHSDPVYKTSLNGSNSDGISDSSSLLNSGPRSSELRRQLAYSTVGTPDYIAPEVFEGKGYGRECDWWSLGAILYEMLIGYAPFSAKTQRETYHRIMNWRRELQIPGKSEGYYLSFESFDLIKKLLCDAKDRLGSGPNGVQDIMKHPFFRGIQWDQIRNLSAPFEPQLTSAVDTSYFIIDDGLEPDDIGPKILGNTMLRQQDAAFAGYTYRRFETLSRRRRS